MIFLVYLYFGSSATPHVMEHFRTARLDVIENRACHTCANHNTVMTKYVLYPLTALVKLYYIWKLTEPMTLSPHIYSRGVKKNKTSVDEMRVCPFKVTLDHVIPFISK